MSELPTLLFIPGAWHQPTCYNPVVKPLEEHHRFRCISITLPSTTGDPNATFKDDIDTARAAIASETTQGRDVIVIAHSFGGMVGNSAVKGFSRPKSNPANSSTPASSTTPQSRAQSQTGYVVGIILIASGYTLTGVAFMDPFFGIPPPTWRINKETGFAEFVVPPSKFFYHDLPADEAEYWVSQLTPQSLKALFEGGEHAYAGWLDVPSWYVGTIEDQGMPVVAQRIQVGMAREMGGSIEHRELQTSHSPFLSQPEAVVEILVEAVEALTGQTVEGERIVGKRGQKVSIPVARILQPFSWVKYGLPLLFGRMIGRGVLIFGWGRRLWRSCFS
ncbi:Alpha/beta hydrolase family-domain-containing protein [Phaeosphaeriaceae sp. PMI808]|nr:Alpha/beta hydrolase family-domain-containing protein [Phaeosphaeriaceae sp. PMI808]